MSRGEFVYCKKSFLLIAIPQLQITESVCQVRDLMDFSMREKERHLGPIGKNTIFDMTTIVKSI